MVAPTDCLILRQRLLVSLGRIGAFTYFLRYILLTGWCVVYLLMDVWSFFARSFLLLAFIAFIVWANLSTTRLFCVISLGFKLPGLLLSALVFFLTFFRSTIRNFWGLGHWMGIYIPISGTLSLFTNMVLAFDGKTKASHGLYYAWFVVFASVGCSYSTHSSK